MEWVQDTEWAEMILKACPQSGELWGNSQICQIAAASMGTSGGPEATVPSIYKLADPGHVTDPLSGSGPPRGERGDAIRPSFTKQP